MRQNSLSAEKEHRIRYIAKYWRDILEKGGSTLDVQFRSFPQGACSASSMMLCWAFREESFSARVVAVCSESRDFSHAWVIAEGLHVDITGDQFSLQGSSDPPSVYVSRQIPYWARGLSMKPYTEDSSSDASIRFDYQRILEKYGSA